MLFAILLVVLIVFLSAFIAFLLIVTKMSNETFQKFCSKKVERIAKRNNSLYLNEVSISNFDSEKLGINHVIFGKKYIYLISDLLLRGFVSGDIKDNSWIYFNNVNRKYNYLTNLYRYSEKNIKDFAGILQISPDPIVFICLVPNECDFKIEGENSENKFITHFSSLRRLIRKMEKKQIGTLDKQQIYEQFEQLKKQNEEERK